MRATLVAIAAFAAVATSGFLATPAGAERYVAMGDSYSSGTGTNDYYEANCQRSNFAYGSLIKGDIGGTFRMVACSGAKTAEVLNTTQQGNPPQVNLLGADTEHVSISIGGNDADFTGTLLECGKPDIWPLSPDCSGAIANSQSTIQNTIPGRLDQVMSRIRQNSPNARISLVGYPRLFPANGEDCSAATFFSASEIEKLNQTADLLSEVMRGRARANGATYVDARPAFLGHAWCEDEWINGLSNPTSNSYHPNKAGHVGYAGIVRAAMLAAPAAGRSVAPNGRIAFSAASGGGSAIVVIGANGANRIELTPSTSNNVDPVFSPDGERIAFSSDRGGAGYDVYTMKIDGTDLRRLTTAAGDDREPTYSPNGSFIAFRSARSGTNAIFRMTASGASQTNLSGTGAASAGPDWSPDGSEIAFERGGEVFKMNADGQGLTNLTGNGATIVDGRPAYSPDGSKIAFHSNRDGNYEIYTMSPTGGSVSRRTNDASSDRDPEFSPDGAQIAFRSNREGADRIFTMPATTGAAVRRTSAATTDARPAWQGDSTPPRTTIGSGPGNVTNSDTPTFEFSADEPGSTFECRFGTAQFQSCTSPYVSSPLADGPRRFQVRAIDPSGNVDPNPATLEFTVDTQAKVTSINAGPSGATSGAAPEFTFASENSEVTFECRLLPDRAAWEACGSPFAPGELDDGQYRFEVRGTDLAGNVESPAQSRDFTVDTVAPVTAFSAGPAALGNDSVPTFEFGAGEPGVAFECELQGSGETSWVPCVSPFSPEALADGSYLLRVRATDLAGNVELEPIEWPFEIDTAAPVTTIDSAPGQRIETRDAEFEFSASDDEASFECRLDSLDDSDWVACESPASYTGLEHGLHRFQVRASDPAGNVEQTPRTVEFGVDVIRPEVTIDSKPSDPSAIKRPAFAFHSIDPGARFECRIDGPVGEDRWEQCVSPFKPQADLNDGRHQFRVRAADVFGKVENSPVVSWLIDATPPVASIAEGPRNSVASATARFELAADEEQPVFQCSLDQAAWTSCSANPEFTGLAEGPHQLRVRAVGPLSGNGPVISRNWTVDLTAPVLTIESAPSGLTRAATAEVEFRSSEAGAFRCRLDSADETAFAPCTSPHSLYALEDGAHRLDVRAIDEAGNASSGSVEWRVLSTPPPVQIDAKPARYARENGVTFAFSSSRAIAASECRIDAGQWATCQSPVSYGNLREGSHDFAVRVTDEAGNTATAGHTWDVDMTSPAARFDAGPTGETRARNAEFSFSAGEAGVTFECALDGAAFEACSSPSSFTDLTVGAHQLSVRATDRAGNTGPAATRAWTVLAEPVGPPSIAPKVTLKKSVKLPKSGKAKIGTVTCGSASCQVIAPRIIRGKLRGKKVALKVQAPRKLPVAGKAAIRVTLPKKARAALRRGSFTVKFTVRVSAGGESVGAVRKVRIRL